MRVVKDMEAERYLNTNMQQPWYQQGETGAPEVVALGRGKVAEKIIALAKKAVPVHENPELAYALSSLRLTGNTCGCTRLLLKYCHSFYW